MSEESVAGDVGGGVTLSEAAGWIGGRVEGDPGFRFVDVTTLEAAGPDHLGFLASRRYRDRAGDSAAGAFLVSAELESAVPEGRPRLVVDDAHRALQALLTRLHPEDRGPAGVHPTAVLGQGVELGDDVGVGPYAVLDDGVRIGSGTRIGAHCVVGRGVRVGRDCLFHPHVVLYPRTTVGDRAVIHAGARLGSDGFGWAVVDGLPRKMPHVGRCIVEDDVEIGANTTLDRGSIGDTRVGAHAKLDNLVHLGHNVQLGSGSLLAAMVGIAGSTRIGRGVLMGGQAGVINHLELGDGVQVGAASAVLKDVPAGTVVQGAPARPSREYLRRQAHVERLPKLVERVKELEARLDRLDPPPGSG